MYCEHSFLNQTQLESIEKVKEENIPVTYCERDLKYLEFVDAD